MKELAIDRPVKEVAGFMGVGVLCRLPVDVGLGAVRQFSTPLVPGPGGRAQSVLLCTL